MRRARCKLHRPRIKIDANNAFHYKSVKWDRLTGHGLGPGLNYWSLLLALFWAVAQLCNNISRLNECFFNKLWKGLVYGTDGPIWLEDTYCKLNKLNWKLWCSVAYLASQLVHNSPDTFNQDDPYLTAEVGLFNLSFVFLVLSNLSNFCGVKRNWGNVTRGYG